MALAKLPPTLWRTCRVLANRTRLRMFALLMRQPALAVSQIATRFGLPRPIASMYLRALESRGLLEVHRQGRWARYRVKSKPMQGAAGPLVRALVIRLRREPKCFDALYRSAAAFANPGRIEVFRQLSEKPMSLGELRLATHLNQRTLFRHVRKLEARGFLVGERLRRRTRYHQVIPQDIFSRSLALLATGD